MYLFRTLDPHPPTATPILGQSPKKNGFAVKITEWLFSLKILGLWTHLWIHLPIVWDKVPNKSVFFYTFPYDESMMVGGVDDDDNFNNDKSMMVNGDDLHLLLDVPQLLFKLLSFGLVGRFDVLKMGNSYLK